MTTYNIYCDESCHLENDGINVMVLGAVSCPQAKLKQINDQIKEIKRANGVSPKMEAKWTKASPAKVGLYLDLINYYFDDDDLHFRAIVIPDKSRLDHARFKQTHDDWYYKMYFEMLKVILTPSEQYEIYLDIKDTCSGEKVKKLQQVCKNSLYDFSGSTIKRIQSIRSEEVQIMQLVDLLIGAVGYVNRIFDPEHIHSPAKQEIIQLMRNRTGYSLNRSTLYREEKCNIFVWNAG